MKKEQWSKELETELAFWERWIKGDGIDTAKALSVRTDPERLLSSLFEQYLNRNLATNRILDVGSGPLTTVGFKSSVSELDICAVDPLADEYVEILDRLLVETPVKPQKASGEALTETFEENSFDLSIACNALDHSFDPMKCIEQMTKVTKTGGFIVLQHNENEGTESSWHGLHNWDFSLASGRFIITRQNGTSQDVASFFSGSVEVVEARQMEVVARLVKSQRSIPHLFVVVLKKIASEVRTWPGWS